MIQKWCSNCGETYQYGGILWMPTEPQPRGETCFGCAMSFAKLPKKARVLRIKPKE